MQPLVTLTTGPGSTPSRHLRARVIGAVVALLAVGASTAAACDPLPGQTVFTSRCSICHSREDGKHLTGPSLHGLADRSAGKLAGFTYSAALAGSSIAWNTATLDAFLRAPQQFIPGTAMPFGGLRNDADRAALICYLLSDLP